MRPLSLALAASALALASIAGTQVAHAQQQAPAAQDEDFAQSHLAAAQRIIDVTRSGDPFDDILPALMNQTRLTFVQATPSLAREIEEVVTDVAIELAARRADLARTMQLVWARRFSEQELVELHQFFTSPTGSKFAEQTPVISALTLGAARQWEERLANDMVNVTRQRLREKGLL